MSEIESYISAILEIAEATKKPFHSKAKHVANRIAKETLAQWGRKA